MMMRKITTKLTTITSLITLLAPSLLLMQSQSLASVQPQETTIASNELNSEDIYQQAKEELPEDWYLIYRIVDRIARANGLDNLPWRIVVMPEYNVNAFATGANLIAVYGSMLDMLEGNSSAIACVIAHEMGHHMERHTVVGEEEKVELIAQIQAEAEAEVAQEIADAQANANNTSTVGTVIRIGGGIFGDIGSILGGVAGNILENEGRQRVTKAEERLEEIVALKTAELQQSWAEDSRQQELAADKSGYIYSVRAGFKPEGCLKMMEVLDKLLGGETEYGETNHPMPSQRQEEIQALITQYPPQTLVAEGKAKLSGNQNPLNYSFSQEQQSLRINRRSSIDDLENLLGY